MGLKKASLLFCKSIAHYFDKETVKYEQLSEERVFKSRKSKGPKSRMKKYKVGRIRVAPKLRIKKVAPSKARLAKFRDGYVNMMLWMSSCRFFSTRCLCSSFGVFYNSVVHPFGSNFDNHQIRKVKRLKSY
ncbi:hypothetical protein SUGI_0013240 [Cryptomeria japonica]|nr:hypothetical protein SUGI_0013240 [Cryptomeria japonica]